MRQIKFRAWNVENQEMIDADSLAFDYYEPLCEQLRDSDEMKFMQFTGLTDKNGVEVFESDIVQDHIGKGVVKYSEEHAAWRVHYLGSSSAKWFIDYLPNERKTIEVIGNIHSNPELLEKNDE